MREWIKWYGGEGIPVSANTRVDVDIRGVGQILNQPAGDYGWSTVSLIAAYRLASQEEACEETEKTIGGEIRTFETGATRNVETGKLDYEGFLSPLVLERFAVYMDKHRVQADGNMRDSDNWQRGMPKDSYIKSGWRHFMDWWKEHRGIKTDAGAEDALCAVIFNAQGYLLEVLKDKEGK